MSRRKSIIILPHLNDKGGDISKRWYIEYHVREPKSDKMQRFRLTSEVNRPQKGSVKSIRQERYAIAQKLIAEYTNKLQTGWTPFEDSKIIYDDQIKYHQAAKLYGKKRLDNKTIRYYSSLFLTEKKREVKQKTFESYQSKMRSYCLWLEKHGHAENHITAITNAIVVQFFYYLTDHCHLTQRTIDKYAQNLRRFYEWLNAKQIINFNPLHDLPKAINYRDCSAKPINKNDIEAFKQLIKSKDPQLWLALQFEYYCYIRPGNELRNMRIKWINFSNGTITVPAEFAKNGKTETVVIPENFLIVIKKDYLLSNYNRELYVFGRNRVPGMARLGANTLRDRFNSYRKELGLSDEYKFYSWKHTGAMMASNAGIPVKDIQMQMRHHSLDITDKYLRKMKGTDSVHLKKNYPDI